MPVCGIVSFSGLLYFGRAILTDMKLYVLLLSLAIAMANCSKKTDSPPPPETDAQKAAKICWVGYSQMTVSKNSQGTVRIIIPIAMGDSSKLKAINLYIKGPKLLWSNDKPKSGTLVITDQLTDWSVTKTQTYNFEFVLNDGTKLRLDDFSATP